MPIGLEVVAWQRLIKGELFKDNAFLNTATKTDQYVNHKTVVIPQSGAASNVEVNRSVYPATATRRTDTDITYDVKEYTTDPRHITDKEMKELSYAKMQDMVRQDMATLKETVADDVIYEWAVNAAAAHKVASTGAASQATADGATGNRLIASRADLRKLRLLFNLQNLPQEGRHIILPSNQLDQLLSDKELEQIYHQQITNVREGQLPRLYGFQIHERSRVLTLNGSQTIMARGAANSAADTEAAIAYHSTTVERALGEIKAFMSMNDPQYYGHLYSSLTRMGARANREDGKGVAILYNAAAA
jgi:hypothetical protein